MSVFNRDLPTGKTKNVNNNTILKLLRDSTHVNFDDTDRIKVPALVRGTPGIVEYRGMPWLRGMFAPQPIKK